MTATIPMDFYPKLNWSRGEHDVYAQGIVKTQQDTTKCCCGQEGDIVPRAKPQILEFSKYLLVAEEMLHHLLDAEHCPTHPWERWATVEVPSYRTDGVLGFSGLSGCLLHISGINRTLTYRIGVLRDIGAYECTQVER